MFERGARDKKKRRTFAEVEAAARAEERADVLAHVRHKIDEVEGLIARGRGGSEEGSLLQDRLRAFAGDVRSGLHVVESAAPGRRRAGAEARLHACPDQGRRVQERSAK